VARANLPLELVGAGARGARARRRRGLLEARAFHGAKLWRFHAAHHSSERVDWLSNERFHPIDALAGTIVQAGLLLSLGFAPSVVALNAVVRRTYSMFVHADTRLSFGPLDRVLVSPTLHRWHHSDDVRLAGRNFATLFAFVDVAFGTFALPPGEAPRTFGLGVPRSRRGAISWLLEPLRWPRGGRRLRV
jgi:sterol desaturase/sphingolipid hydroxylase (fatty acid hydroxylase superfamily)